MHSEEENCLKVLYQTDTHLGTWMKMYAHVSLKCIIQEKYIEEIIHGY